MTLWARDCIPGLLPASPRPCMSTTGRYVVRGAAVEGGGNIDYAASVASGPGVVTGLGVECGLEVCVADSSPVPLPFVWTPLYVSVQNGVFNCPLEVQIIPFVCSLFETCVTQVSCAQLMCSAHTQRVASR